MSRRHIGDLVPWLKPGNDLRTVGAIHGGLAEKPREPKTCCVIENGVPCGKPAFYKLEKRGFCERHKPVLKKATIEGWHWRRIPT
jgi:hypothetical protein